MTQSENIKRYRDGTLPELVTIPVAAEIIGIGRENVREYCERRINPLPHRKAGARYLVEVAALQPYYRQLQQSQLNDYQGGTHD